MKTCGLVLAVVLGGTVWAEDLVIQSFEADGTITFNSMSNATEYTVEEEVGGTWNTLSTLPATGSEIVTASVSMIEPSNLYCVEAAVLPAGMVLIPGGTTQTGTTG